MTPSVLTRVGFCIGISITILGCGDHGLKIHEQAPTASLLDPGDNDSFVEGMPVAFRVQLDDNDVNDTLLFFLRIHNFVRFANGV